MVHVSISAANPLQSPTPFLVLGLAAIAILLGGCGGDKSSPKDNPVVKELQEEIAAKNAEIEHLNQELAKAHQDTSKWSTIAIASMAGIVVGVIISLVVGAAMGSRTKHDSRQFQITPRGQKEYYRDE